MTNRIQSSTVRKIAGFSFDASGILADDGPSALEKPVSLFRLRFHRLALAAIDEGALVTWTSTTRSFVRAERIATLADRLLFSAGSVVEISGSVIPPPLRAPPHPAA